MIIRGRVVDAEGRLVAGARICLGLEFASLPATGAAVEEWKRSLTSVSGPDGEYSFTVEPERRPRQHARVVFATHDRLVSQRIVVDWGNDPVAADLVLVPGVVGRVRVLWDDGSPASAVSLEVMLSESLPEGADARAGNYSLEGTTDEKGEMSFGPIRDVVYGRIAVRASHPDAPTQFPWWDNQRVSRRKPVEVSLSRGRVVRGRLLTPEGQPAGGYLVAPWGGETGDPEMRRIVITDAEGRFEVKGVGSPTGAIAVYDRAPGADSADMGPRAARAGYNVGQPLLIEDVQAGSDTLEVVSIPRLGTVTICLEDARGEPVSSGIAYWTRPRIAHGGTSCRVEQPGVLRLVRIPLGIAINIHVTFDDSQYGELEQSFEIREVREETVALRATGAGTVIFRLHPKGAPEKRLTVSHVNFGEHDHHGAARDGPLSELRWWTRPGFYRSLRVAASGFREHRIENVEVRDDGPTFLDIELEPS